MDKRFFRADGSELLLHDTEDKNWWLAYGEDKERAFLSFCGDHSILSGISLNPEREGGKHSGKPEFIYKKKYLDLKVQHQPFFESERLYNIPPRYAVTLNWRDVNDVRTKYPECLIVYWLNWIPVRYLKTQPRKTMEPRVVADISIDPLHGVWTINPSQLSKLEADAIREGRLHWYMRRIGDTQGNAKSSYVIDIRETKLAWLDPSCKPIG